MSTDPRQVLLAAVVTAVVSLLVAESYQSTPWLADKFMRWSVRLRYTDNPQRAEVRREELISLLADLPTLFKLPTAAGFLLRALTYRATRRRKHARREPRPAQHSRGAGFRIALAKAVLVTLCVGTVSGVELAIIFGSVNIVGCGVAGLISGTAAASEFFARSFRFRPGFISGVMCALSLLVAFSFSGNFAYLPLALFSGAFFGLAAALVNTLTGKSKNVGFIVGALVNLMGIMLATFVPQLTFPRPITFIQLNFLDSYGYCIGLGLSAGAMVGFVTAVGSHTGEDTQGDRGA